MMKNSFEDDVVYFTAPIDLLIMAPTKTTTILPYMGRNSGQNKGSEGMFLII